MKALVLCFLVLLGRSADSGPINATYDQRQNGKVNVHISIKDVAIILQSDSALNGNADDDINYDYDYDYDHLTVKPNGIWATLGQTTAAAPINPANPPPTPGALINPGFLPTTASSGAISPGLNLSVVNGTNSELPSTENEESESEEDPMITLIQYPIPADYKPPPPLETLSEASHPYLGQNPSSESPIIKITSKKPGNRTTHKYAWNGDLEEIPVEVIIEPVLKNKQRQHVVPGARSRPTRKYGRTNGKPSTNKFGM